MEMMHCFSEEVLALYVEGDLPETRAVEVDRHVRACAACGAYVAELRDSQSVFKSLRQETVTPSALASVRGRVLDEIGSAEDASGWVMRLERLVFMGFRRRYALAGVVIAVILSGVVWRSISSVRPSNEPVPVAATLAPPTVAPVLAPTATIKAPAEPAKRLKPRPVRQPKPVAPAVGGEEPRQIVMKILTDDPNIVIYWLLDQKGAGE